MMLHQYFKERSFDRLFKLLKQKYISLGRFSGTITLNNISKEESIDLSNFFGQTINEGSTYKTSFAKIEKKLKETKYADFTWEDLFKNYFNENIMTKVDAKASFKNEEHLFYQDILLNIPDIFKLWFKNIIESKNNIYHIFLRKYKKDKKRFKSDLLNVLKIMEVVLKKEPTTLTMLASISTNPHFLDFNTGTSNLFFKLLADFTDKKEPKNSLEKINFLTDFNIYIDSLSNFVIIYNLESDSDLVQTFTNEKEPLNLNLSNLQKINKLDTKLKKVFVFENPSMLIPLKKYDIPLIISYGNPNYIFYKVLEKLNQSNNEIYYNGDFDPEGLIIAHNIYNRFPNTKFFCYKKDDYNKAKSKNIINKERLKKLDNINNKEFTEIINLLKKEKVAGYQESNIDNIEIFIKENLGKKA